MDLKRNNSNKIVTASSDNSVCLWNLNTGKSVYFAGHTNDVLHIIDLKHYNENYIATCSGDNNIKIWNLINGNSVNKLSGHTNSVNMILHLDKLNINLLLSCSIDCTVRLWNINTGKEELCFKGHTDSVSKIIHPFEYHKNMFISASLDMKIKLWEIQSIKLDNKLIYRGALLREFVGHYEGINDLLYLKGYSNKEMFLSAGQDKHIRLWSLVSNSSIKKFTTKGNVVTLKHLKRYNTNFFASGGIDNFVYIWNISSGEKIQILQGVINPINIVYPKEIDDETIIVSDNKDLKVFNFVKGNLLKTIKNAHEEGILYLMYSSCKEILVSGCIDASVKIWKLNR